MNSEIKELKAQVVKDLGKPVKGVKSFWKKLGPGLTTGAADDDPSGIATYSQTGAQYGFQLIWLSFLTFPLMATVQEMCARIGIVTGQGLAANIRDNFSKSFLVIASVLLLCANIFNIGANLGMMSESIRMMIPSIPFWVPVVFFGVVSILLEVFETYKSYAKYLKYLAFILFAYVIATFIVDVNWGEVFNHIIHPKIIFSQDQVFLICAILGTTISPYLFFWQTSQEVEEEILIGQDTVEKRVEGTNDKEIKNMKIDNWAGMFFSNLVMFFIIALCGAQLHANGITNITSASDAAEALRPLAGNFSYFLFTIGIIGTGLLAIPVLAGSAAYVVAEGFRWNEGLYRKFKDAYGFYFVIIIAILVGIILNFVGLNPINSLIYSAVGNGLVAPVILYFIIRISSSKKIMGKWVNNKRAKVVGWVTFLLMASVALTTIVQLL